MIDKALIFATNAHKGQFRKVNKIPFIFHPLAVGYLLADAGESDEVVAAGFLHDTVEDTDITLEQIRSEFGHTVAELVDGCSENKNLSWKDRKTNTIKDLESFSDLICIVTCADKIHNLMDISKGLKKEGKDYFIHFKKGYNDQKWYYENIKNVLGRRIPGHPLYKKYVDVFNDAFGLAD